MILCRDCCKKSPRRVQRCPVCGSPRVLDHPELFDLTIAHLDCDAFYAAVEKRDNPSLADKPVIIGGGKRGVVSTACYVARTYGIHSAMPMFKALQACPEAVVIKPSMKKYAAVSREVRALMEKITPAIEPISIDEAFLDLSGTERLHKSSAAESLARLAGDIHRKIGITVSIGLSHNKFLAKVASDLNKPRGFAVIGRAETLVFLKTKPVTLIWGVGKALNDRLRRDGIKTIGQLQQMAEEDLIRRYGVMGRRLARLSRGEDARIINRESRRKSISAETTFFEDISDYDNLEKKLWPLCERVSAGLKQKEMAGKTVTLKLKTARHKSISRSHTLGAPTQLASILFEESRSLLKKEARGQKYRLIGVGIAEFADPHLADPPDLIDPGKARKAGAERAVDAIREKFGPESVKKGRSLKPGSRR